MKLTNILLACCLFLIPIPAVSGSDGIERAVPSGETDVMSYVRAVLTPAREYLSGKARSLGNWARETLGAPSRRTTPRVIIDLPPPVMKAPAAAATLPEQPEEEPATDEQAARAEQPETLVPEAAPVAQPVSADAVAAREEVVKQEPVRKIRIFQPGKPKPARPVDVVEIPKVENSVIAAAPPAELASVAAAPAAGQDKPAPAIKNATAITPPAVTGLMLGQSMRLGSLFDEDAKKCINKQNGYVLFCAQDIIWPEQIRPLFDSSNNLYRGTQAVVRYDNKKLTHAHALFSTSGLKEVVSYFETRFGPPLEAIERIATPFEDRPRNNPTIIWRKNETVAGKMTAVTLEVRGFDDTRGGFPDMKHGLVRLYGAGSLPIFPRVSATEMMLVKHALN